MVLDNCCLMKIKLLKNKQRMLTFIDAKYGISSEVNYRKPSRIIDT